MKLYKRSVYTKWQLLMGPAHFVDALVETVTLGFYSSGWTVQVARKLLVDALAKKKARNT